MNFEFSWPVLLLDAIIVVQFICLWVMFYISDDNEKILESSFENFDKLLVTHDGIRELYDELQGDYEAMERLASNAITACRNAEKDEAKLRQDFRDFIETVEQRGTQTPEFGEALTRANQSAYPRS